MWTQFDIHNIRGIEKAELRDLARLNVLVGPNNAGKTTCLESIALAVMGADWDATQELLRFVYERRGGHGRHHAESLLRGKHPAMIIGHHPSHSRRVEFAPKGEPVRLRATLAGGTVGTLEASDGPVGPYFRRKAVLQFFDANQASGPEILEKTVSQVELGGQRAMLLDLVVKTFAPAVTDLRILTPHNTPCLYVEEDRRLWPAFAAGDGMKRLLLLASRLALAHPHELTLIEDPDAFLHLRALRRCARVLFESAAKQQIIVTTHSRRLVRELIQLGEEDNGRAAFYVIRNNGGVVDAARHSTEEAELAEPAFGRVLGFDD